MDRPNAHHHYEVWQNGYVAIRVSDEGARAARLTANRYGQQLAQDGAVEIREAGNPVAQRHQRTV